MHTTQTPAVETTPIPLGRGLATAGAIATGLAFVERAGHHGANLAIALSTPELGLQPNLLELAFLAMGVSVAIPTLWLGWRLAHRLQPLAALGVGLLCAGTGPLLVGVFSWLPAVVEPGGPGGLAGPWLLLPVLCILLGAPVVLATHGAVADGLRPDWRWLPLALGAPMFAMHLLMGVLICTQLVWTAFVDFGDFPPVSNDSTLVQCLIQAAGIGAQGSLLVMAAGRMRTEAPTCTEPLMWALASAMTGALAHFATWSMALLQVQMDGQLGHTVRFIAATTPFELLFVGVPVAAGLVGLAVELRPETPARTA